MRKRQTNGKYLNKKTKDYWKLTSLLDKKNPILAGILETVTSIRYRSTKTRSAV